MCRSEYKRQKKLTGKLLTRGPGNWNGDMMSRCYDGTGFEFSASGPVMRKGFEVILAKKIPEVMIKTESFTVKLTHVCF